MSLTVLPARVEKVFSAETRKLGDLVIAHQNSVQRMASLLDQESRTNGEGVDRCTTVQDLIERQLAAHAEVVKTESEKLTSAIAANGRLLQRVTALRILLSVILSDIAGLLTVLIFEEMVSSIGPMFH